jgi:hypothetical protein
MEQKTSRRTRSQKSADQGRRDAKFRDWLEAGGGIFIQLKPAANLQNQWEDETSLVFSHVSASSSGACPALRRHPDGC